MSILKIDTTLELINNFRGFTNTVVGEGTIVETLGYSTIGDGGGAQWKRTGNLLAASQSPAQLGDARLSDKGSNEWALVIDGGINIKSIGGADTLADNLIFINTAVAALTTGNIIFPDDGNSVYTVSAEPNSKLGVNFIFEGAALFNAFLYPAGFTDFGYFRQGSETTYKAMSVYNDTLQQEQILGSKVNGLKMYMELDGGHTGGRHVIYGLGAFNGASDVSAADRNYVGVQGQFRVNTDDGGTNPASSGTSKGAFFGASTRVDAISGATSLLNVSGCEFNTAMLTGSSCWLKTGLQVVDKSEVRGTIDAGLLVAAGGLSVGWDTGLLFADTNGGDPMNPNGTLIGSFGNWPVAKGIDFSTVTFSGDIFNATNFAITNLGSMELGSLTTAQTTTIDFHSSGNNIAYDARISAFGGSATLGAGALALQAGEVTTSNGLRPTSNGLKSLGLSTFRWLNAYSRRFWFGSNECQLTSGTGSPEGNINAAVGSIYTNINGAAGTTLYIKESGTGNTGWVAK